MPVAIKSVSAMLTAPWMLPIPWKPLYMNVLMAPWSSRQAASGVAATTSGLDDLAQERAVASSKARSLSCALSTASEEQA